MRVFPDTPVAIAAKQLAAEELRSFTQNGQRVPQTRQEIERFHILVDEYNRHTMPFAPWDYAISSRKQLVDDIVDQLPAHSPQLSC